MSGATDTVVEVGTLAFDGLSDAEARRAAEEFERVLAELLDAYGLPEGVSSRELGEVRLDELPADADTPEGLGRALARALYRRVAQ